MYTTLTSFSRHVNASLVVVLLALGSANAQLAKSCTKKYLGNIVPGGGAQLNYKNYWNAVTSENDCKWGTVERTRGTYNFTNAKRAWQYAKDNNMKFRYHAIAWGNQFPTWAINASNQLIITPAEFQAAMENYMKAIAKEFPTNIDQIDVLNEQLGSHAPATGAFRQGLGGNGSSGHDWIIWLFTKARQYFPGVKLVLNDYGLENSPSSIDQMVALVKDLKSKNLIDGFGTQAHTFNVDGLSATTLKARLDQMAQGGVPIYVTELDLTGDPNGAGSEDAQLKAYQTLFPVYWEHPNVAGVTLWGYVSGTTWKDGTGIMSSSGTERKALKWIKEYMASAAALKACGGGDPQPVPTISLTAPSNNSSSCASTPIAISANATVATGSISKVDFYDGNTLVGTDATSPYSYEWSGGAPGIHTIRAVATSAADEVSAPASVSVTITGPAAPVVASPIQYGVGETAQPLTASGNGLKWYTFASNGTALPGAPTPSTTSAGSTTYYVSQTANNCEGPRARVVVNVLSIYTITKTNSPMVVDGTIEEAWEEGTPVESFSKLIGGTVSGASDLSGTFKARWDNNYLYVLGEVTDDVKSNDSPDNYNDDGVEIYVDINNDKAKTYGANDVQYTFGWNDGTTVGARPSGRSTTNITYAIVAKSDGYVLEARIPWTTLQGSPSVGLLLGFDFLVNDDDNGTDRDGKLAWNAKADSAWTNPSFLGTARLGDVPITTNLTNEITSNMELQYYPNPFQNTLTIQAAGEFHYSLCDMTGEEVEKGTASQLTNSIGLDLPVGMYIVKVNSSQGSSIFKVSKN